MALHQIDYRPAPNIHNSGTYSSRRQEGTYLYITEAKCGGDSRHQSQQAEVIHVGKPVPERQISEDKPSAPLL